MDIQKKILINAVIRQIKHDLARDDTSVLSDLLDFLNEDVMIAYIPEDKVEIIFPG